VLYIPYKCFKQYIASTHIPAGVTVTVGVIRIYFTVLEFTSIEVVIVDDNMSVDDKVVDTGDDKMMGTGDGKVVNIDVVMVANKDIDITAVQNEYGEVATT